MGFETRGYCCPLAQNNRSKCTEPRRVIRRINRLIDTNGGQTLRRRDAPYALDTFELLDFNFDLLFEGRSYNNNCPCCKYEQDDSRRDGRRRRIRRA